MHSRQTALAAAPWAECFSHAGQRRRTLPRRKGGNVRRKGHGEAESALTRPAGPLTSAPTSPDGGIGRRARFRSVCRKAWRFESSSGHHFIPTTNGINKISLSDCCARPYVLQRCATMLYRLVRPMRRSGSRNVQFVKRIPADLKGRLAARLLRSQWVKGR